MSKSLEERSGDLNERINELEEEYERKYGEPTSSAQVEIMYKYVLDNLSDEQLEILSEYNT